MKQTILKLVLLIIIILTVFNCQEEKINSDNLNSQINSKVISINTISYESSKYVNLKPELNKLRPSFNSNHFSARNYDEPILVDSSSIKHIITDDGYESFTFNIINSEDAYLLENLVLSKKNDEDIQTFLVKYNLNEAIENIDLNTIDGKIDSKEYIKLDYDEDGTVSARCGNVCVEAGYYITVPSCQGELVTPGENPGCFNEDGTRGSVQVFVQIAQACTYVQCGGSSGGNYTNNNNTTDTGDNVTSSGGNFTTTYTNPDIITTPIKISAQQQLKTSLGINNLTPEIISWIDDLANTFTIGSINQFLIDNNTVEDISNIAAAILNILRNNSNLTFEEALEQSLLDTSIMELFEDQIFIDDDFKNNDCLKSVYDAMGKASTFKNYLQNFEPEFSVAHLRFSSSTNLSSNTNAETSAPENFNITITFNENKLDRPRLSVARTFIHEMIHAEIFRKLLSVAQTPNLQALTPAVMQQLRNDYPGLYDYYIRWKNDIPTGMNASSAQHQAMAQHYRDIIKQALMEFDSTQSNDIYDALSWVGLKNTIAWNNLTQAERDTLNQNLTDFENNNPNCQ